MTTRAKAVSRVHAQYLVDLPDRGCWASSTYRECVWRECVFIMPPSERRVLRLALRVVEEFRAPPDRPPAVD